MSLLCIASWIYTDADKAGRFQVNSQRMGRAALDQDAAGRASGGVSPFVRPEFARRSPLISALIRPGAGASQHLGTGAPWPPSPATRAKTDCRPQTASANPAGGPTRLSQIIRIIRPRAKSRHLDEWPSSSWRSLRAKGPGKSKLGARYQTIISDHCFGIRALFKFARYRPSISAPLGLDVAPFPPNLCYGSVPAWSGWP